MATYTATVSSARSAARTFDYLATFSNAAPVLTVVWGVWFFHEVLTPTLIIGGLLTLGGIFWTNLPASRPTAGPRVAA